MSDFPETPTVSSSGPLPDYQGIVAFLLKPFVEVESQLQVNSEFLSARARVWVRVAFDGDDSTRLLGRGGRNIQAVRLILEGIAEASGHTAYLDVYGNGQPSVEKKVIPTRAVAKPRPVVSLREAQAERPPTPKPVKKVAAPPETNPT
jgi:uncharacterized protein